MGEKREYRRRRRPPEDMELHQQQVRRRQTRAPYPEERRRMEYDETYIDPRRAAKGRRMSRRKAEQRKRRRRSILLVIALVLLLIAAYAGAKVWVALGQWEGKAEKSDFTVTAEAPTEIEEEIINVAILGTDEDGVRADVDILASFNTTTKELHLISVPRDTCVTMTDEMIAFLEKNNAYVPQQHGIYGQCKLTEVHNFAGKGNRCAFSVAMMEEILGVKMDYYVKVDLDAFKKIVDAVGGVDFYVPMNMYWDMRDNGGPLIDLREGMQHLNGDKAEQLVRFRDGYAQKDLKRIEVQRDFIQALIQKICSSETLLNNLDDLVKVVLDCTESNITVKEALKYVKYVKDFDPSKITSDTIPYAQDPGSYFYMDEEGTKALIDQRIYGIEPQETEQNTEEPLENENQLNG